MFNFGLKGVILTSNEFWTVLFVRAMWRNGKYVNAMYIPVN